MKPGGFWDGGLRFEPRGTELSLSLTHLHSTTKNSPALRMLVD